MIIFANSGADSGLGSDKGPVINGGYVFAAGSDMDMASENSSQVTLNLLFNEKMSSKDSISFVDSDNNIALSYSPQNDALLSNIERNYNGLVISSPDFEKDQTYMLYKGKTEDSDGIVMAYTSEGRNRRGNMRFEGNRPENGEEPGKPNSTEIPENPDRKEIPGNPPQNDRKVRNDNSDFKNREDSDMPPMTNESGPIMDNRAPDEQIESSNEAKSEFTLKNTVNTFGGITSAAGEVSSETPFQNDENHSNSNIFNRLRIFFSKAFQKLLFETV